MGNITSWQEALTVSWAQVWSSFLSVIPQILGGIIIFAVGLVLAYWVKRLVVEALRLVKFEKVSKSLGIDDFLEKADIQTDLAGILGVFAEWTVILVFFLAVVDVLGLTVVSQVLVKVVSYIPNIIAAALIFGAGYFVAGLVGNVVRSALVSVDLEAARPVGKFARGVVLVIVFFAAVNQLQIAQGIISIFFQGLTYTVVLAIGLSVGLGAKDLVSKILTDWYEKVKK
jgi:hypothetical protein